MATDPAKSLDIDSLEAALDELLEHYRQALRAVELLPTRGHVANRDYLVGITPTIDETMSHFRLRCLVRIFLRSHVQSKLRVITGYLEVERFAGGHMDANTSKRLGNIVRKLRVYDKSLTQRRALWLRLLGWIWPPAAPVLFTLATVVIPSRGLAEVFGYVVTGVLVFASLAWFPLFAFVGSGAFSWKRLILLGRAGDVNINIPTNTLLHWVPMPQANTYESENRFFRILGLPKPDEFPWDILLTPPVFLSAVLALVFFMSALYVGFSAKESGWPILIAVVLLIMFFFCLDFILRSISRAKAERRQRSAC